MKLFLTGASGFIGAETLRIALEEGHEVVAPVRPGTYAPRLAPFEKRFTRIDTDIHDQAALAVVMRARDTFTIGDTVESVDRDVR